ncbi:MAG: translation initiation factor IF-2 associated domain-containing protein [Alphaproteobacteria bacterium]|nr:translation initiation factor IF-2 associated domain-containing protein [Alphaproteobacteria bacterium]
MTEESAKGKLTLSKKSTLTLKNVNKPAAPEGKKVVQVEVRKKRIINPTTQPAAPKVEIDEATAQKLKLLEKAKEYEAKRKQEEEAKETQRKKKQAQKSEEDAKKRLEAEAK